MNSSLRILIVISLVVGMLSACLDHRLTPTPSLRLRLKTVTSLDAGRITFSREFTYAASNRLASYTNSAGTKIVYEYDGQNRYKRYVTSTFGLPALDEVTQFVYNSATNDFQVLIGTLQQRDYTVDNNKRILRYTSSPAGFYQDESYVYTDDNITTIDYKQGPATSRVSYEYDTHPNPYYGLIGGGIRSEQSLSRNNVTKSVNNGVAIVEYTYEYNTQGLPVKQKSGGLDNAVFTYESY